MLPLTGINKATTAHLKKNNETLLLREIYAHKAISRVSLAQLTRLSRPSVTELTQSLIKRGLVVELGQDQLSEKVGKKPTLLAFNTDAYQMIAVGVNDTFIIAALLDMRMQIIEQQAIPMSGVISTRVIDMIVDLINIIRVKATQPLLGIVVGTPGVIDSQAGTVYLATNLGWKDLPLARVITERFQVPVYIGNDSNMIAMGESRFGLAQDIKDLIVVKIGTGIGVGTITDGHLVKGSTFAAGELGHTPFPALNDVCLCGRRGCLETMVSWWSLKQRTEQFVSTHPHSSLSVRAKNSEITLELLADALQANDPDALALVSPVATYLSHALLIMVHLLNPSLVMLTGSMVKLGEPFLKQVREMVQAWAFPYMMKEIKFFTNEQDDLSILLGAGALLLEKELGL